MDKSPLSHANPESYRRSSPFVIVSYVVRGFAIASTEKLVGLLVRGSGGAVLALYALSALQMFGVHWSFRLLVVCFCVLIVQLVVSLFKYATLQFRYDNNKISAKTGFRTQTALDFEWFNVRSILLIRSAFQRRLNLASISLVTAGSSKNTIEIPYIPYSLALEWENRVKEQKIQTEDRVPDAADTDPPAAENEISVEEQQAELVHKLNFRNLVRASLASGNILVDALFGFFVLGIAYCVYRFIYQILMSAPNIFELDDMGPFTLFRSQINEMVHDFPANFVADSTSLLEVFQQFTGLAITQFPQGRLLFFISLSLILASLFYVINRIWYVVKYYNFELTERGIHLQAEDGLTKKRRVTIRRDRVQTTSFRANFVERSLNRGNVSLENASKFDCRIPFVTTACADRILRSVTDKASAPVSLSPVDQSFSPIHVLSFVQNLIIQVVFFLPVALILIATFIPLSRELIWPYSLLLFGYAVIKIFIRWKRKGYIIDNDFFLLREGGASWSSVKVALLNKVQSMSIKQSWIQRMRNRATINFHLASGVQAIPFLSLSVAEAMQRAVEARIRGDGDALGEFDKDESAKDWKSLPQRYIVSLAIGKLLTSVFLLVPVFVAIAWAIHSWLSVSYTLLTWILALAWGAMAIWRVATVCLKVPKFRYACGHDDIVVKESFLSKQTKTVRYSRLQSVSTANGLINGFFGLSGLNLYTAEDEVNVRGLDWREAFRLREYIAKRLIETSSTGTDALTMTEHGASSVDSEAVETAAGTTITFDDSTSESDSLPWKKFCGWTQEIVMRTGIIILLIPWLLLILAMVVIPTHEYWLPENGEHVFSFVLSWYFYAGIWLVLSLWVGSGPFIAIPRKGYSVSADALRHREGWLFRVHRFVPLSRIQNVSIAATIYDRIFKVRSVKVATASEDEITLASLSLEDAEELRAQLLSD